MRLFSFFNGIAILSVLLFVFFSMKASEDRRNLELAAQWFLKNQNEEFLYYIYDPVEKIHAPENHPLREMASMWAIAKAGNFLGDPELTALAEKGFEHFEEWLRGEENPELGYYAFLILTLLEIDHPREEELMREFVGAILALQKEDGSFTSDNMDYYPGEALLALVSYYETTVGNSGAGGLTSGVRVLDALDKAFLFYRDYWRENPNTAFVPWQSQAWGNMVALAPTDPFALARADFVFEMNDYMLGFHGWNGEFGAQNCRDFNFSLGSVTGVYVEGVNAAVELAEVMGESERASCYSAFVREGLDALSDLQFRANNSFGIAEYEEAALGGIIADSDHFEMRVDRNQHYIMALIGALD